MNIVLWLNKPLRHQHTLSATSKFLKKDIMETQRQLMREANAGEWNACLGKDAVE